MRSRLKWIPGKAGEFASQPPCQIVPTLVDRGEYVASESTIYRVMKAAAQQHHRDRAKKPATRVVTSHCATEPNRLWSWDITWLPTAVRGLYFYWYMVLDVYSRKIVGHEVHAAESAELAALLMRKASLAEGLADRKVVLHSLADAILRRREQVYEAAKQRCPQRWSGPTRNWKLKDDVWLNPERAVPEISRLAA